ncbi:putative dihydrouridine synthase [Trypanosoma theileri]|uniref:Putative dihydrouridine synthase n=1 Tax=Trypanosoma theileri TaxID=67003 RepID=A0A1X0P8K8_9TRYP|nr:putative dihydrouridine synthase [Trypanosoma theileri]ORC93165.1 putative dihydrouridine synthase [Trypanosoma theileri]
MSLYQGKTILAPMVRICNLGFRVFCAAQGADVVFSEETVAAKLVRCRREIRVYDESVGPVVEFVTYEPFKKGWKRSVVFSTLQRLGADHTKDRPLVVVQLGVSNPSIGAQAACLLCEHVDGIDVNMGCPKKFSVENGMGAALMRDAERAAAILVAIDSTVNADDRVAARGSRVALSFKIRLRETAEETAQMLIDIMERVGPKRVHAITLHARTVDQSSDTPPYYDRAAATVKLLRSHPLLKEMCFVLNGSVISREDGAQKMIQFGFDAVMIARHAMWDMSVFSLKHPMKEYNVSTGELSETPLDSASWMDLYRELIRYYVKYRTPFGFVKYHLTRSIPCITSLKHLMKDVQQNGNCYEDIAKIFDIPVEELEMFRSVSGMELVSSIPEDHCNSLGVDTTVDSKVANNVLAQDDENSAAQTIKKLRTE